MKCVALLSGGLDSTVLISDMVHLGFEVEALSFEYGQRHARELQAAQAVTEHLGIAHIIVPLPLATLAPTSSLTSKNIAVPLGHYEDDSMRATVVPNRNMILLAFGIARAIATDVDVVAYAAHKGDHAIYPDCRAEFVHAMRKVATLCDYAPVALHAPYLTMTKADIVTRGASVRAPFELTYSCYQGRAAHCGQCGTCVERKEAFAIAGVTDPTRYECLDVLVG